jgi:hypothetical protein
MLLEVAVDSLRTVYKPVAAESVSPSIVPFWGHLWSSGLQQGPSNSATNRSSISVYYRHALQVVLTRINQGFTKRARSE